MQIAEIIFPACSDALKCACTGYLCLLQGNLRLTLKMAYTGITELPARFCLQRYCLQISFFLCNLIIKITER